MLTAVVSQICQRTVFELMLWLSEQVTFIPGQRQRLCAPLLFKALTQQATIEAYRVLSCLPIYQQGHNLYIEFSFDKNRPFLPLQKDGLRVDFIICEYFMYSLKIVARSCTIQLLILLVE